MMDNEAAEAEILTDTEREIRDLRWENDKLTRGGIIEVAVRNRSVAEYMEHWEGRALKAEALLQVQPMDALSKYDDKGLARYVARVYIHEGSVAIVYGTNDKPVGWIDTHAMFKGKVYRDRLITP